MSAFFRSMEKLEPVYDWTYRIIMVICKLLLIGDILITAWAIAGRYIPFIEDPAWSEEIVLTFMVYMAVLSATLAIRTGAHIRMTAFDRYLSPRVLAISDLLADTAVFILGIVLIVSGIRFCVSPLSLLGRYSSLPGLSKIAQYLSIPVAGFGMAIFELSRSSGTPERWSKKNLRKGGTPDGCRNLVNNYSSGQLPDHDPAPFPHCLRGGYFHGPVPDLHGTEPRLPAAADG